MNFKPRYSLAVETQSAPVNATALPAPPVVPMNITIELPYVCDFEIRRATLSSASTATFRIYGLGPKTRDLLQKDWFNLSDIRAVQFRIGYGDDALGMVFNGTLKQAQSARLGGSQDWVTEIEAFDGGSPIANGISLRTIAAGTQFSDIIKTLAKDLPGLAKTAFVGNFAGTTLRGSTFAGRTWDYIFQLSSGLAFIDAGQLKALQPNQYAGATIPSIESSAGLIGTPQRYMNLLRVTSLMQPAFTLGQLVNLKSSGLPRFNGVYKVAGLTHRGRVAQFGHDGERRTELTLWNGLGNSDSWEQVLASSI